MFATQAHTTYSGFSPDRREEGSVQNQWDPHMLRPSRPTPFRTTTRANRTQHNQLGPGAKIAIGDASGRTLLTDKVRMLAE